MPAIGVIDPGGAMTMSLGGLRGGLCWSAFLCIVLLRQREHDEETAKVPDTETV